MTNLKQKRFVDTDYLKEQLDSTAIEVEGSYITATETKIGAIQDLEILGNTVQDPNNLVDIKSVGVLQEDGTYKMSISSCGKNLFNPFSSNIEYALHGGIHNKVTCVIKKDGTIIIKSNNNSNVNSDWGYIEFKNIKVTPNKSYTIHPNATVIKGNVCVFVFDSNNTKLFEIPNTSKTFIPTTKHITIRLYVQTTTLYTDAEIHYKPQLEEGTVATPYEPYQGNKCDILLPCQLEKVGDVSDRLYYDDVEKAWCIEKNIGNVVLNGSERTGVFNTNATLTNYIQIIHPGMKLVNNTPIILSTFKNENYSSSKDYEYGYSWVINGESCIYLNFLKSKGNTDSEFKTWLSQNPTLVKYQLATPQKIVLPLDVQIQLNSFFGTTHIYMESGEVEGTIKCKIPKSLGATVQSLNNKTDILSDRIEAIEGLKDSQNMKYETDKGYLVCKETKNGVIDDLKIEGKTLVNLWDINKMKKASSISVNDNYVTVNADGSWIDCHPAYTAGKVPMLKPNTEYTVIAHIKNNTLDSYMSLNVDNANRSPFTRNVTIEQGFTGYYICKLTTKTDLSNSDTSLRCQIGSQCTEGTVVFNCIVLEGDHTQNPPSYFEGLMSVGEDIDKIEVLSRKEDGNLFDKESIHLNKFLQTNGDETSIEGWFVSDYIKVADTCYIKGLINNASSNLARICVYDQNKTFKKLLSQPLNTTLNISQYIENEDYIKITEKIEQVDDIIVCKNEISNQIYQSDKKQILFYNENGELEPVTELHEWDSIEKHSDNKWYYHKRSGKVVLNGSENWIIDNDAIKETSLHFRLNGASYNLKPTNDNYSSAELICDKFTPRNADFVWCTNTQNPNGVYEGIAINTSSFICVRVLKSKLSTQDVEGFKQWLQANNVTVVYQLAKEEVYELAPLHLDSYANETLILCNSGAISPKMEFSITSHINELVKAYGERINLLEEKVYQYMVTQNRMQLASTYSADSVTFNVDYFSLCGDEENYNEDLYNLILNNILVGKDNYDYDKMFTMILDYASWNQISWEQFDILVGLMDMQHNPPVEELPTEDEIEEDIIEEDIIENEETPVE